MAQRPSRKQVKGMTPRDKARAFLDEMTYLCEKYDLLHLEDPEVCSLRLHNNGVTAYVKIMFEPEEERRPEPEQIQLPQQQDNVVITMPKPKDW